MHENIRFELGDYLLGVGDEIGRKIAAIELHAFDDLGLGHEAFGLLDRDHALVADLGYSARDWLTVREEAARAHNERTANYLLGMPLVGDYLEEGLSMFGYSCEEFEIGRL
jgi:hypothetical protein